MLRLIFLFCVIKTLERKMANKIVYVQKLGRVPYKMAWDYQKVVAEKVRQNVKSKKEPGHTMLLLEHEPGKSLGAIHELISFT